MKKPVPVVLAIYLTYMFVVFKTTICINHPFEAAITSVDKYLKHPISSDEYESKICPFGRHAIVVLVLYLLYSGLYETPTSNIRKIFLAGTFILSLMNMNAFTYLIPYFMYEVYNLFNLSDIQIDN